MSAIRLLIILTLSTFPMTSVQTQTNSISAAEAKDHLGENATVCGKVVSARYANKTKGEPTFLNLDKPYPKQIFTILIWGNDRLKFGNPSSRYNDQSLCVTGKIMSYRGTPEIVATNPDQVEIRK